MAVETHPVRIFIAYAHEDAPSRERLRIHLNVLQRRGLCHIFWDGLILPGERWDDRLKAELHRADIFLLLVSEHFLDSDYVHEVELPKALELRQQDKAEVLPVILRHCPWKYTELADFQCILYEGLPIEISDGFAYVADLVAETSLRLKAKRNTDKAVAPAPPQKTAVPKPPKPEKPAAETSHAALEKMLREEADYDLWEFAEETDTEAAYKKYLQKYPAGLHTAQAKQKLDELAKKQNESLVQARPDAGRTLQDDKRNENKKREDPNDPFAHLMVQIKGGTFDMGDVFGEGEKRELPDHRVTLKDFYLCKYPVTQDQWKEIMGENPSQFKGDDLPVENVSWEDAQEFIQKLNQRTGQKYRLPTEAEWEYAAREGGKKVRFGNGKDIADPKEINFNGSKDYKQSYSVVGEYRAKTTPVGTFSPNALGLHDMSGNVWEWCEDWYHDSYKGAPTDGSAWLSPAGSVRVLRGGSWDFFPQSVRAAYRFDGTPVFRHVNIGFRLARTV